MAKRPSFQWYPADHRKDVALHECSLESRGLWLEVLCIMHESDKYGHLSIAGKPMDNGQIARAVGESVRVVSRLLRELEDKRVFSRLDDGTIYCRRMVRDEHLRIVRSEAGAKGAAATNAGRSPDVLPQQTPQQTPQQLPQQKKLILPQQKGRQNPGKSSRPRARSSSSSSFNISQSSSQSSDSPDVAAVLRPAVPTVDLPAIDPHVNVAAREEARALRRRQLAEITHQATGPPTTDD